MVHNSDIIVMDYKVLVLCCTYNQSNYIEDSLRGFAIQKTDFPFVCLVLDDASTDGEQDVIRDFLSREGDTTAAISYEIDESEVIKISHKSNKNCTFAVYFLKKNLYGTDKKESLIEEWRKNCKYEAFCEGDDYWTDSLKLQKQVTFMETHSDYSICFHSVLIHNIETGRIEQDFITRDVPETSGIKELGEGNYIHTLSVVVRINEDAIRQKNLLSGVPVGDYPTWVIYSQYGKIYKFSECMGVYRYGIGVWSKQDLIERRLWWLIMLSKLSCIVVDEETKQVLKISILAVRSRIANSYYSVVKSKAYTLGNMLLRPMYYLKEHLSRK